LFHARGGALGKLVYDSMLFMLYYYYSCSRLEAIAFTYLLTVFAAVFIKSISKAPD